MYRFFLKILKFIKKILNKASISSPSVSKNLCDIWLSEVNNCSSRNEVFTSSIYKAVVNIVNFGKLAYAKKIFLEIYHSSRTNCKLNNVPLTLNQCLDFNNELMLFSLNVAKYLARYDIAAELRYYLVCKVLEFKFKLPAERSSIFLEAAFLEYADFTKSYAEVGVSRSCVEINARSNYDATIEKLLVGTVKKNRVDEFSGHVKNKEIAIVGPSLSLGSYGEEIDAFDVVVRLNHYSDDNLDMLRTGKRCDITYFNKSKATSLIEENICLPDQSKLFVFKTEEHVEYFRARGLNSKKLDVKFPSLLGSFNLLPLILCDLLSEKPKSIKLYGFDLYTNKGRPENYLTKWHEQKHDFSSIGWCNVFRGSSIRHDPVLQYFFLQRLWSIGLIKGDAIFEKIMNDGLWSYVDTLCDVYAIVKTTSRSND